MKAKIIKYFVSEHILLFLCFPVAAQSLSGDIETVPVVGGDLYQYYRDIAYNFIVVGFTLQAVVTIIIVARNGLKSKRLVINMFIATAILGILWAVI